MVSVHVVHIDLNGSGENQTKAFQRDGTVVEKGTLCKMARGEMVRYLAQVQGKTPEQMKAFDRLGYQFRPDRSDEITYVFCKEDKANVGSWNESA